MNILIVEDDPVMSEMLKGILIAIGDEVFVSHTIEDAGLQMLRIPPPDIIFLDLIVPPFTAEETLSKISTLRKPNPKALIIVLTGSMQEKIEQASFASGADAFLHKNDMRKQSDVWRALKAAIDRRVSAGEQIFEATAEVLKTMQLST